MKTKKMLGMFIMMTILGGNTMYGSTSMNQFHGKDKPQMEMQKPMGDKKHDPKMHEMPPKPMDKCTCHKHKNHGPKHECPCCKHHHGKPQPPHHHHGDKRMKK
ncbi:MAG: hypothetical protein J6Y39_01340 [Bacteroidaceae bacterium]|nr:hypothetical protein [Bacteroidaceae bacterium]